jgi:hypothetical protein
MAESAEPNPASSTRELLALLLRGHESKDLDYKGPCSWRETDKKACCELVKDILAMGNTLGGYIVVGVSEVAHGFSWNGLSSDEAITFDTTRINRFVQNYSDPPINAFLRKVQHDGKLYVVIEVPQFTDTPHICQKDFPGVLTAGTLYVRTDNNESAPIKSSADFRIVLEQAVRNRRESLLTAIRTILKTGSLEVSHTVTALDGFSKQRAEAVSRFELVNPIKAKGYEGYREVSFFPAAFVKDRFRIDQLRSAAHNASISFTGWPFLFIHVSRPDLTSVIQDGLETLISTEDFGGNDMLDFWRFQQSGFFYHRTLMWEDAQAKKQGLVKREAGTGGIPRHIAEAILCLTNLYRDLLEPDEDVNFSLRILGAQDRILVSPSRFLSGSYIARISEIQVERTHALAEWQAGLVDHAVEISKEIFLRFNWQNPNLDTARNLIDDLFSRRM